MLAAGHRHAGRPGGGAGWILLTAVLLALMVLMFWLIRRRTDRSAAARWRSKLAATYAQGRALLDSVGVALAYQHEESWHEASKQAREFADLLGLLEREAPGEQERGQVIQVMASVEALRFAMGADTRTVAGAEDLRGRMDYFASVLQALRGIEYAYL